jgi:dCMP deaminase
MRPNKDHYWLGLLTNLKERGTCPRRQTAALIVDDDNHIISTGYNGPPKGFRHCTDWPCLGAADPPGDSSRCFALHAEQNALLQAGDRLRFAETMYCTTLPCFTCAKLICNTSIKRVIYQEDYKDQMGKLIMGYADIKCFTI